VNDESTLAGAHESATTDLMITVPTDCCRAMSVSMLDHALELAACGWQVLPLRGKIPYTAHGSDDASSVAEIVRAFWERWPNANLGAKVPDPLIVFDVDPRNRGLEGWAQLTAGHDVPDTMTVVSGRGDGGTHRYFLRPHGPISAARIPKGIDLKKSGYMVMPPSLHPDTRQPYTLHDVDPVPLPSWLREVLRPAPPKTRTVSSGTPTGGRGLVEFVARQVEGNINKALYWAAHRAIESGVLDQIEPDLIAAAIATGENRKAAERTVNSARKKASC
jgi:hypothetical protein